MDELLACRARTKLPPAALRRLDKLEAAVADLQAQLEEAAAEMEASAAQAQVREGDVFAIPAPF